jgi:hypothetical protein
LKNHIYIGIDDTDNKESRGTGYRARKMADLIQKNNLGSVDSISRHQLFVHEDIPFTSQNSSACLEAKTDNIEKLTDFCREFLLKDSAEGSDVGLCVAKSEQVTQDLIDYGFSAKKIVLNQKIAKDIAAHHHILLEGLTGTKDGIIGSLSAIGLRASGNDGRFIWLNNTDLREFKGILKAEEIIKTSAIDTVLTVQKELLTKNELINLGDWVRPVLQNNKKILIVEKSENTNDYEWKVANKEYIKSISQ